MFKKYLGTLALTLTLGATLPHGAFAQNWQGGGSGQQQGQWDGTRDWRGGGDDRWDNGRWDGNRDNGNWGHWRRGPISVRNSRSYTVYVQVRDRNGVVRSSFYLGSGDRRYVRTEASSSWSISVRSGKSYRRYTLDDIGYFDDSRWYVRIR